MGKTTAPAYHNCVQVVYVDETSCMTTYGLHGISWVLLPCLYRSFWRMSSEMQSPTLSTHAAKRSLPSMLCMPWRGRDVLCTALVVRLFNLLYPLNHKWCYFNTTTWEHKFILWLDYLPSMYDCATKGTSIDTFSNFSSVCTMLVYVVVAVRAFRLHLSNNRCYKHCSTGHWYYL